MLFTTRDCVLLQLWKEVSGQLFFAVLTFQLVMLGLLGLKASLLLPAFSPSESQRYLCQCVVPQWVACPPKFVISPTYLYYATCGLQPCHCAACAGRLDLVPS